MLTKNKRKLYNPNRSPASAKISKITTKALVEPLPQNRGKSYKSFKKLKQMKKVAINTKDDINTIQIINSSDNRTCTTSKIREINSPRTFRELNESTKFDDPSTSIVRPNPECFPVGESLNMKTLTQKIKDEKNDNTSKPKQLNKQKRKENTNKSKRKITRKSIRRQQIKLAKVNSSDSSDTDSPSKEAPDIFQNITRSKPTEENKCNDFNEVVDSIRNTFQNKSSTASQNIKASKQKNKLRKPISKTKSYYGNMVMRQCPNDGFESLHSDNELESLIKKCKPSLTPIKTKKRQLKFVAKPISFKPIFRSERKSSSSSSYLPELEIEVEAIPPPFVPRGFSDSDDLDGPIEDNIPKPVNKVLPQIHVVSSICLKEGIGTENIFETCFPVSEKTYCDTQTLSSIADTNLEGDQNLEHRETNLSVFNISSALELTSEHSNEPIFSWIATGLPHDATEIFRRTADSMLSNHANSVKVFLEFLKGTVDPSLRDLHDTLMKEDSTLDKYFMKKT